MNIDAKRSDTLLRVSKAVQDIRGHDRGSEQALANTRELLRQYPRVMLACPTLLY